MDQSRTKRTCTQIKAGLFLSRVVWPAQYSARRPATWILSTISRLSGIRRVLAATRHLLEMYRRGLSKEKTRRMLQRLDGRLLDVAAQLDRITTAEK